LLLIRYFTDVRGALCPLGYGTVNGNGLSIFKNPLNNVKTLVAAIASTNLASAPPGTANVIKIGMNADGSAHFNSATSPMHFTKMSMDGARFLNPARPGDLYISNNRYNNPAISWSTPEDASAAVQVFQVSYSQWNVNASISAALPSVRFCPPSAGPIVPLGAIKSGRAPAHSALYIKLYNSVDCNPQSSYSPSADPAALGLQPGVTNPISIPFAPNACNNYNQNGITRAFKLRCLSGEQSLGILLARKYFFADYNSTAACLNDAPSDGRASQTPPGQPSFALNPIYGAYLDAGV
jgi:hypothetical protein